RAMRGLSFSAHHAELFYLASSACFELAATTEAVRLLAHTLWVNPGHARARGDGSAVGLRRPRRLVESGRSAGRGFRGRASRLKRGRHAFRLLCDTHA